MVALMVVMDYETVRYAQ